MVGIVREFLVVGVRIDAATHDHQFFRELGKPRIAEDSLRDVGHRTGRVDRHLVGILVDRLDEKIDRALRGGLGGRIPFRQLRNTGGRVGLRRHVPCAVIQDLSVDLFPGARTLFGAQQRMRRAGIDPHIGSSHQFQQAQGVRHFLIAPSVAGHDGDPQHFDLGRLKKDEHGIHVGPGRPHSVLVDHHITAPLGVRRGGQQPAQHREAQESSPPRASIRTRHRSHPSLKVISLRSIQSV